MSDQVMSTVEPYLHLTPLGCALVGYASTRVQNVNLECNTVLHATVVPNLGRPLSVQIECNRKNTDDHDADIFIRTPDDDLSGYSRDGQVFLSKTEKECVTLEGNI